MTAFPKEIFNSKKSDFGLINKMTILRKDINIFINGLTEGTIKYNEFITIKDFINVSSYILFPDRYDDTNSISLSFSNSFYLVTCAFENCDKFEIDHFDKLEEIKPYFKKIFYDLDHFSEEESKTRLISFLISLDKQLEESINMELN